MGDLIISGGILVRLITDTKIPYGEIPNIIAVD